MSTLILLALLGANAFDTTFLDANRAYEAGNYAAAVRGYEHLVASDAANAEVFYNLGNAHYRLGHLGEAIANYERALHLKPGFIAAQDNLDQALRSARRALPRPLPPAWERALLAWHYGLSYGLSRLLAFGAWMLCWALLALRLWRPLPYLRAASVVVGILALAFGVSAWNKAHPPMLAVVTEEMAPARFGRSEAESVRFELYAGDRVAVDLREKEWSRVSTVDGKRGWVTNDGIILVGPPYETTTSDARP